MNKSADGSVIWLRVRQSCALLTIWKGSVESCCHQSFLISFINSKLTKRANSALAISCSWLWSNLNINRVKGESRTAHENSKGPPLQQTEGSLGNGLRGLWRSPLGPFGESCAALKSSRKMKSLFARGRGSFYNSAKRLHVFTEKWPVEVSQKHFNKCNISTLINNNNKNKAITHFSQPVGSAPHASPSAKGEGHIDLICLTDVLTSHTWRESCQKRERIRKQM